VLLTDTYTYCFCRESSVFIWIWPNTDTLREDRYRILIISRSFLLRVKNVPTKCVESKSTHFYVTFFKSCPLWETLKKNIAEPGRPQMTIWRKRIACLYCRLHTHIHTHTHTHTHSEYVICNTFCFSTTKTVAGRRFDATLCLHCLPSYLLNLQHLVTYVLLLHYRIILSGLFVRDGSFSLTSSSSPSFSMSCEVLY